MKASIHISTYMVEVLSYTKSGNQVTVRGYNTCPLPDECVINGVILDGNPIIEGLKALNNSQPQLLKDVSLVIDGSFVYTKRITVPGKLGKWMYNQVIRDEFADISSDAENLICDYYPLCMNTDGSKQILACAVEKAHAETYLAILRSAGVEPATVRLGTQVILRYIGSLSELKNTPFVLNLVDDDILTSMIFQKGVSVFQSRTRLFGEDRATLVQGTLDGLSGIIQFNKSQNFDDIKYCFYLGLSASDMDLIKMNNTYQDISFNSLDIFKSVKGAEILPPNAHIAYLNALAPDSEPDLLHSMRMLEKIKKRNKPKNKLIPVLVVAAVVLMAVIAVLWFLVSGVEREVQDLNDYMNSPKVLSEKAEIERLNSDTNAISSKHIEASEQINEDNAKPHISKQLIETIVRTGGGIASVVSYTFSDTEGTFRVNATAINEMSASSYVEQLRGNSLIEYVEYLGFSSDSAGAFSFSIEVKAY